MKKIEKFLCCMFVQLFLLGFACSSFAIENLIENPGFEEAMPQTGSGWNYTLGSWEVFLNAGEQYGNVELSSDSHAGSYAIKLEATSENNSQNNVQIIPTLTEEITGEQQLTISGYLKTTGDGVGFYRVKTYNAANTLLQTLYGSSRSNIVNWQRLEMVFTTHADTQSIKVEFCNGGQGTVLYDDLSLSNLPPEPTFPAFPNAYNYFPYGGYFYYVVTAEFGNNPRVWECLMRQFRKNNLNTGISVYLMQEDKLAENDDSGTSWMGNLFKKYNIKMMPKMETVRFFTDGVENFPENLTSTDIKNLKFVDTYNFDICKNFAADYTDTILAYNISDEPRARSLSTCLAAEELFHTELSVNHPAIPLLNMDMDIYLNYVPIYFGDHYPIRSTVGSSGRNPWDVGKVVKAVTLQEAAPPVWVMLQAFSSWKYKWELPTIAELRLMTWAVIANGGKGVFYHGIIHRPRWRVNSGYDTVILEETSLYTDQWVTLGEIGKNLRAIGPILLKSNLEENNNFTTESDTLSGEFYNGPAITVTALKDSYTGGYFLALQNQDINETRTGTLVVDSSMASGRVLYDMFDMQNVSFTEYRHQLTLKPGDARFFYLGSAGWAVEIGKALAKNHYLNEKELYDIDSDLALNNNINIATATAKYNGALNAFSQGNSTAGYEQMLDARSALTAIITAQSTLTQCLENIATIRDLLSEITLIYKQNLDYVIPPSIQAATAAHAKWNENTADPVMQYYLDETADCLHDLLENEENVYKGQANAVAIEFANLLSRTQQLSSDVLNNIHLNPNASFENETQKWSLSWTEGGSTLVTTTETKHTGTTCLKYISGGTSSKGGPISVPVQVLKAGSGKYNVTGYVKISAGDVSSGTIELYLNVIDGNGNKLKTYYDQQFTAITTDKWIALSSSFSIPKEVNGKPVVGIKVSMAMRNFPNARAVFIDDLKLFKAPEVANDIHLNQNASFENGTDKWSLWHEYGATIGTTTATKYTGTKCLKYTSGGTTSKGGPFSEILIKTGSGNYKITNYIKISAGAASSGTVQLYLYAKDSSGSTLATYPGIVLNNIVTDQWIPLSLECSVPSVIDGKVVAGVQLGMAIRNFPDNISVFIDDYKLFKTD